MAAPRFDLLTRVWTLPPGLGYWLAAVNHRAVGMRFMVTAFIFFLLAGLQALVMRVQLSLADLEVVGPGTYNQLFTMHGTTMMFLFVVPFLEGLGIYLVPLMIGARDMAFPRLNAFGYWIYLVAGVVLYWSFFTGTAPHSGWFNYVPLSGAGFSPGVNIDYWVTMITFLEVAALVAAVELIVTIFRQRAPGMSINRMPLFVWSILVMAFMIIFAMPPLVAVSLMLGLDRVVGTHFFNVAAGGDPLLWQHLFWFFGHPDVYIMLVPALGIICAVVPVFARRPIAGYTLVVLSFIAIGFLSFGLWVHHMYASGLPIMGMNFFTAASMMITIPSGIQIFAWIVTIWRGRLRISTSFLFAVGFIVLFIAGGITGIMVASVPFDWQVHDTFFVVAHFHYVLVGGVVFPIFAAIYYWYPKMTGRLLSETEGRWSFWLTFIGFNVTFFPMHQLGFDGMPRRIYTYLPELAWDGLNLTATLGAFVMAIGIALTVWNIVLSRFLGVRAGDNPWDADTLEWATASPPPAYNFGYLPVVGSGNPLWDPGGAVLGPSADPRLAWREPLAEPPAPTRETPASSVLDAEPDHRLILPGPSVWPLWAALALGAAFLGAIIHPVLILIGGALAGVALIGWLWPRRGAADESAADPPGTLPLLPRGPSTIWLGMALLVVIELAMLLSLIFGYFYLRAGTAVWPPPGVPIPDPGLPLAGLGAILLSAGPVLLAERAFRRGRQRAFRLLVPAGMALAAVYVLQKLLELGALGYRWDSHAYGSAVWTLSGSSLLHAVALLPVAGALWLFEIRGDLVGRRRLAVPAIALYWYFVSLSSVLVFATIYLAPRLLP